VGTRQVKSLTRLDRRRRRSVREARAGVEGSVGVGVVFECEMSYRGIAYR
jgi:hypothetical protein